MVEKVGERIGKRCAVNDRSRLNTSGGIYGQDLLSKKIVISRFQNDDGFR